MKKELIIGFLIVSILVLAGCLQQQTPKSESQKELYIPCSDLGDVCTDKNGEHRLGTDEYGTFCKGNSIYYIKYTCKNNLCEKVTHKQLDCDEMVVGYVCREDFVGDEYKPWCFPPK